MDNIINNYPINNHLEVCVCEGHPDLGGTRVFVIVNTDSGIEEQISDYAARVICINPDSTITPENWEDFCSASGVYCEAN